MAAAADRNEQRLRRLIVALAAIGWLLSLTLFVSHKWLAAEGSLGLRICSTGSECATVLKHPKAVLWGLPLAAWGMLYFSFMIAWPLVRGLPHSRTIWEIPILGACLAGIAISCSCVVWMGKVIGAWCPWCLASQATNLVLVGLILTHWVRVKAAVQPLRRKAASGAVAILAAELAVLIFLSGDVREAHARLWGTKPGLVNEIVAEWRTAPLENPIILPDDMVIGDPAAPHTLVMFTDFHCPFCREAHPIMLKLMERLNRKVRLVLKQYPYYPTCNSAVQIARPHYARSCQAAWGAAAAGSLGGPKTMKEYAEQILKADSNDELEDAALATMAQKVGVDGSAWRKAYESAKVRQRVDEDIKEGQRLKVEAVPVFYLDGKRLKDAFVMDPTTGDASWVRTAALWENLLGK